MDRPGEPASRPRLQQPEPCAYASERSFSSNLEVGFGSQETGIAFNFDALYHMRLTGSGRPS